MSENPKSGRSWPICRALRTVTSHLFFYVKPTRTFCPGQSFAAIGPMASPRVTTESWSEFTMALARSTPFGHISSYQDYIILIFIIQFIIQLSFPLFSISCTNPIHNTGAVLTQHGFDHAVCIPQMQKKTGICWCQEQPKPLAISLFPFSKFLKILRGPGTTLQTLVSVRNSDTSHFNIQASDGGFLTFPAVGFKLLSRQTQCNQCRSKTGIIKLSASFLSKILK